MSIKLKLKLLRLFSCCCCFKGLAGKKRLYKSMNFLLPLVRINAVTRKLVARKFYRQNMSRSKRVVDHLAPQHRLVWVDLEMTGLDLEKDKILEMACVITDADLNVLKEGPKVVIHQPEEVLSRMNGWCQEHHKKSGLTEAVRQSTMTVEEAQDVMVQFVREYIPKGKCPLAGNSVHVDRLFLVKYMKPFVDHLHYRIVDVSTVKELCRRWYADVFYDAPVKSGAHRASTDIYQSIEELKYYRSCIFK